MRHRHNVETKTAILPSAGYDYRKPTRHTYSHSELVTLPCETGQITGLGHYFRCQETNELRRWGFEASYEGMN